MASGVRINYPTPEELQQRIDALLAQVRMTRDELDAGAEAGQLSADEYWLLEDIEAAEFLLGA